jgi:hypothetical protein
MFRVAVGVGIILLSLAGCTEATEPVRQLEVSIAASSAVASAAHPTIITVSARNHGHTPVDVHANACPEAYRVSTVAGEVVGPGPAICAAAAMIRILGPGEHLEFIYSWAGTTREQVGEAPVQLPAAEYRLQAVVFGGGREIVSAAVPIEVAL